MPGKRQRRLSPRDFQRAPALWKLLCECRCADRCKRVIVTSSTYLVLRSFSKGPGGLLRLNLPVHYCRTSTKSPQLIHLQAQVYTFCFQQQKPLWTLWGSLAHTAQIYITSKKAVSPPFKWREVDLHHNYNPGPVKLLLVKTVNYHNKSVPGEYLEKALMISSLVVNKFTSRSICSW